tara:strand:+ start:1081 stop:1278 length:198 start_codon:yes stop_codon:yes gene_type:complete
MRKSYSKNFGGTGPACGAFRKFFPYELKPHKDGAILAKNLQLSTAFSTAPLTEQGMPLARVRVRK